MIIIIIDKWLLLWLIHSWDRIMENTERMRVLGDFLILFATSIVLSIENSSLVCVVIEWSVIRWSDRARNQFCRPLHRFVDRSVKNVVRHHISRLTCIMNHIPVILAGIHSKSLDKFSLPNDFQEQIQHQTIIEKPVWKILSLVTWGFLQRGTTSVYSISNIHWWSSFRAKQFCWGKEWVGQDATRK